MRPLLLTLCLLALAGCGTDPKALGITGPGQFTVPQPNPTLESGGNPIPGVATMGTFYGPTIGAPQSGTSGFWGYN